MNENTHKFTFEGQPVEILRKSFQRTISLRVRPSGLLRVTCGRSVPMKTIQQFLLLNRQFIEKALHEIKKVKARHPRPEFLSGEKLLFLGEERTLEVIWGWTSRPKLEFLETSIELKSALASSREQRQKAIAKGYEAQARLHLKERMDFWSQRMGLKPTRVSFRRQRTRWGSCSSDGSISLNWKLIAASTEVIDYVIIHELAHLVHPNHSQKFWRLVEEFCPDHRTHKKWLRAHQNHFEFLDPKSELHSS